MRPGILACAAAAPTVASMADTDAPPFFVSYSHHDADWRALLFDSVLSTTFGDYPVWSDASLRAGDAWREQIDAQLARCAVAVLLVSPHFLASSFIAERELPVILQRAASGGLRIVWIPLALGHDTLAAQRPELAALQGGLGYALALPARPQDCQAEALEKVRQHVAQQMQAAVDPLGAGLAQRLARRYLVQRRLGEGNLAVVYKGFDQQLKRTVAIKVLKDLRQRDAFKADVEDALRTSEEPNFVNIYDADFDAGNAYCVVQHIRGQTLRALLDDPVYANGLPVQTLRRVFLRLATAIARAHALGICYGNLKPSNIFLDDSFEPFILPVGRRCDPARERQSVLALLARLQGNAETGSTPRASDQEDLCYLVPERFGEQIDEVHAQLADQYMLGVLSYEMATGRRPVLIADPQRLLADGRHAFVPLPPVAQHRRLCPQRLGALVARMANPDPVQRHPRLADVLQEPDLQDELNLVIARDSYRRCAQVPGFDEQFFACFYANFLRASPEAAPFFARFAPGDWARQHRMLKEAVLLLFAFAQQQGAQTEPNLLSRTAASHRHIPPALYAPFLDALVLTVCGDEASGTPAADPACRQRDTARDLARDLTRYWQRALAPGIAYLQGAGQRAV